MKVVKKNTFFKKLRKYFLIFLIGLALMLLTLGIILSLPFVQTRIGQKVTEYLKEEFKSDIVVEEVNFTVFGGVKLKSVFIKDHKKDTLIYLKRINTNILDFNKLYNGDLTLGSVYLDGLFFNLKQYKGEKDNNLDRFIELFDTNIKKKSSKKFLLTAKELHISNSIFSFNDYNFKNPKQFGAIELHATTKNFKIYGPDVSTVIDKLSFIDNRGLVYDKISTHFTYTKKNILLEKLSVITPHSKLEGNVALKYDRKDFSDFNNKVLFDINIKEAAISTNDLKCYYNGFGKNIQFDLKGKVLGTLNNFSTKNLYLRDNLKTVVRGKFNFQNLFSKKANTFYVKGKFLNIKSSYNNLVLLLPKTLGTNLPSILKKLQTFELTGNAEVNYQKLIADVHLISQLGAITSNLKIVGINNILSASYLGSLNLDNFNLGEFINKKDLTTTTATIDLEGKGFDLKGFDTKLKGNIYHINFKNYNYKDIVFDGLIKESIFNGDIAINDPNLKMDFNGRMDLKTEVYKYDFQTQIEYANLYHLKIFNKDSIAVFKGNLSMNLQGNTINDLYGDVFINKTSYQNSKGTYPIDDFSISSTFDEQKVRTLLINSPDIIEGKVVGKFKFEQIQKLVENSIGSIFINYSPHQVEKGQFFNFNFILYNKLIEIFFPELSFGKNTTLKGTVNSDDGNFKMNFNSPELKIFENHLNRVNVDIDNKNKLYNTYIEIDSLKNEYYKISDFSMINATVNDTLFFRTEFKGGNKAKDFYNLNFYQTINEDKNTVVGLKKSEVNFKNNLWYINEKDTKDNKIIFNKKLTDFSLEKITMSQKNQIIELMGVMRDSTQKDLVFNIKEVDLNSITPDVANLKLEGKVNGKINISQNNGLYKPRTSLAIDGFQINQFDLGRLTLDVIGDKDLKNFNIISNIKKDEKVIFSGNGNLISENNKELIDLDVRVSQFNLGLLEAFGSGVVTNVRGLASGTVNFKGDLNHPNIVGRLYLNNAGIKVPYLNVDYGLKNNSIVDITENQFSFRNIEIRDTKYDTRGMLKGGIRHHNLGDWSIDLSMASKRLLALDTKDDEEALYYGTAFIDGEVSMKGPISGLVIDVNAKSEKGTFIKIPINDSEVSTENNFIKFKSPKEVVNNLKPKKNTTYNGVELNFELGITQDAEIEVIINKDSGHGLKGKGEGSMLMEINTLGKFNMWGDFHVYKGEYNFKYGGIIDKKFDVKKGGYISWDGDPLNATLNMEAVYKTQANPGILLENASFTKKIPTEVVIKLTDKLTSPTPDISINFPTLSSVLKSEIDFKLSDNDVRQRQALYLLSSGGFLSETGSSESAITGNLLEKANSLFQDIFSNSEDKLKIDPYFISADRRNNLDNRTDGQVGVVYSTQISDKITINGKFGVPVGGVNESVIVGDVQLDLRLNEDGTLKARVFNRENETNYIGEDIGYTQGIGITYEVDFNTFKELISKILNSKKKKNNTVVKKEEYDSDLSPDFILFTEDRKKKKTKKKSSPEDVAPDLN